MRLNISPDILRIRANFDIEVYKTTQSLITALAALQQFDLLSPKRFISNMDVSLGIEGGSVKELEESTEQLIYQGWITSIIKTWESYRSQMANQGFSKSVKNQQIVQEVIGDLVKIRNSSLHGNGIVGEGDCRIKNCEILKWFKRGDKLIFKIWHVFDFLHHLGLLQGALLRPKEDPNINEPNLTLTWLIKKDIALQSIRRKVISLEDSGITKGKPNQRFIRVLFDNGLFGAFNPLTFDINSFQSVEIVKGNLKFDKGQLIKARDLYRYLVRTFPASKYWSQSWQFRADEYTELKMPAKTEIQLEISNVKVIQVDLEKLK